MERLVEGVSALYPVAILLAFLVAFLPPGEAHVDGGLMGTTKQYCEAIMGDTNVHEYGMVGADVRHDVGSGPLLLRAGTPAGAATYYKNGDFSLFYTWISIAEDGNTTDCDGDGAWGDFDGHYEFGTGMTWILACDGHLSNPGRPIGCGNDGMGSGTVFCWGARSDHGAFPYVQVVDLVHENVQFYVGANLWSNVPEAETLDYDCGDFEVDYGYECIDSCAISFPPGLDGSYAVFVQTIYYAGTQGHVIIT